VAKGRVVVTFGKKKFKISEGKVWIVRKGEVCVVHNPSSEEATMHIVTVDGA
jgi:mannose-6-phosphate isomerase-like protein (cupin superfamily)